MATPWAVPPLKSGGAQHVSAGAVGVAGLRVGGYAGLFPPREATLDHHAEFAVRLAVTQRIGARIGRAHTVGAVGPRQLEQVLHDPGRQVPTNGAGHEVVANPAVREVVAETAVDDVVGVGRPIGHVVARLTWGRVE